MYLYFFKKNNKIYYSITDDELGKKIIEFIVPSHSGFKKVRCKEKHIIDRYIIDGYNDISNIKQELKEKYKFRILLIKSQLEKSDLYKLQFMILDNIFFDVTLKEIEYDTAREELEHPEIWEVLDNSSALQGIDIFNLSNIIPEDVKELMLA